MEFNFIGNKEIENWCLSCSRLQTRTSQRGKQYYYCLKWQNPCYVCLNDCKQNTRQIELDAKQKTLQNFADGV